MRLGVVLCLRLGCNGNIIIVVVVVVAAPPMSSIILVTITLVTVYQT